MGCEKRVNLLYNQSMLCKMQKQSRRARKLYAHFVMDHIFTNPQSIIEIAAKAQDRGLYSNKNNLTQIRQSIIHHIYKILHPSLIMQKQSVITQRYSEWMEKIGWDSYTGLPHDNRYRQTSQDAPEAWG